MLLLILILRLDGKVEKMKIKVHYISLVKSFTKTSQDEFDLKEGTSAIRSVR